MIQISETALNALFEGLKASGVEQEDGLRLEEVNDRLILELDTANAEDRIISHNGQNVLIIAPEFESRVGDAFIDVENTTEGPVLILRGTGEKNDE